jgi:hypothetical protein
MVLVAMMVLQHIGCLVGVVDSFFIPYSCISTRLLEHHDDFPMLNKAYSRRKTTATTTNRKESTSSSLLKSFDSSQSSAASPVINPEVATAKRPRQRINHKFRQLMRLVHETLHHESDKNSDDIVTIDGSKDWKKMKTYFYHNSATLTMTQVQNVLSSLLTVFSPDLVRHIVQSSPRILKRNCKTQLQPTLDFLQSLYGPSLLQQALQRKPDLLLVRGMGYYPSDAASAAGLDVIEVLLRHELKFTDSDIQKLQQTAPYLFQMPMVQVLSTMAYFTEILRAGGSASKSTSLSSSTSTIDKDNDKDVNDDNDKMNQAIRKLILSHPSILYLSLEANLKPRMEFLKEHCHFDAGDLAFILSSSSASILGLSINDNLAPTIDFLHGILGRQGHDETGALATANDEKSSLRKCLQAHPQLLGLSLKNLQSKVSYFQAIDTIHNNSNNNKRRRLDANKSLASRILLRSPAVYSLSLNDNIIPTVDFLAKIWGVTAPNAQVVDGDSVVLSDEQKSTSSSSSENNSLSTFLSEYPSILTLSLEGNLRPTVNFFNRTGYISLDADWNAHLMDSATTASKATKVQPSPSPPPLRGRYIAASLFNRLLPRWHYCVTRENKENESALQKGEPKNADTVDTLDAAADEPVSTSNQSAEGKSSVVQGRRRRQVGVSIIIPLHILVSAADTAFCETMHIDETEYQEYKKGAVPRLKFSSQFDTWLKTGRAIEV